ncbi:hypothetical protein L2E82_49276 [Cichorium intybus]|uniref:Uncharacterized protein n=1 Tax=Cichorium intybus TaxID=13427 RepID=A0ACB8Z131_CICIN|nr:hypothetical protein L2E82_49276 [Cichorium intybus]
MVVFQNCPEFLVYSELVDRKLPYIHATTRVKPEWLARYSAYLCSFSTPLTEPKPYYDSQTHKVYNLMHTSFGDRLWELPLHSLVVKEERVGMTVFCYSLLDGILLSCLKRLRKRNIQSCDMLKKVWGENRRMLYSELLPWFREGFENDFEDLWETMQWEVRLDPEARFAKALKKDKIRRKKVC